jgi:hypothetical protein
MRVNTWWNEQKFKHELVKMWKPPGEFLIRVGMYDQDGRRQHVFEVRKNWTYVLTHYAPKVGTKSWRTTDIRTWGEYGETQTIPSNPRYTKEEMMNEIRGIVNVPQDWKTDIETTREDGRRAEFEVREE